MNDSTLLSRLSASLPRTLLPEVLRRLRACPELWKAAHDPATLDAFLRLEPDPDNWRPGPLGLAHLSAHAENEYGFHRRQEDSATNCTKETGQFVSIREIRGWLFPSKPEEPEGEPASAISSLPLAIANSLVSLRSGSEIPDLASATLAALGLRQQREEEGNWNDIVRAALQDVRGWHLPLACLYGLLDWPNDLIAAIFHFGGEAGARLAVRVLWLNCDEAAIASAVAELMPGLTTRQLTAACEELRELGADGLSARLAQSGAQPQSLAAGAAPLNPTPHFLARHIGDLVELAEVSQLAGRPADAQGPLIAASQCAGQLAFDVALNMGRASLEAGDGISALAAFQSAAEMPVSPARRIEARVEIARAHLRLDRPADALVELSRLTDPPAFLMALANRALGNQEDALRHARRALEENDDATPHASRSTLHAARSTQLETLVALFLQAGDSASTLLAQQALAQALPCDGPTHARLAQMLRGADRMDEAVAASWIALAYGPDEVRLTAHKIIAEHLDRSAKYTEAVEHYKSALALDLENTDLTVSLARAAYAAGQLPLAAEAGRVALRRAGALDSQTQAEAYCFQAEAAQAESDEPQAAQCYQRAVELNPSLLKPWLALADHWRKEGDLLRTAVALEAASRAAPESAHVFAELGRLHDSLGRTSEAIAALSRACELAPDDAVSHRALGILLFKRRYLPGALNYLRRAAELAPDDVAVLHHFALALLETNPENREPAYAALHRAVSFKPDDATLYRDFARVALQLNRPAEARAALETAVELQPGDSEALAMLGSACEAMHDHACALDSYQKALRLVPTRADLNLRLGLCCLALGQTDTAIAALCEAVEADPTSLEAHRELGRAYSQSGFWPEAAVAYERAAELAAQSPPSEHSALHRLHGQAALAVARIPGADASHWYERAVAALAQASEINPLDPVTLTDLGHALTALGRADDARESYKAAISLAPDSAPLRLAAAQAMIGFGDLDAACVLLAEAARLAPNDVEIARALAEACARAERWEAAQAAFSVAASHAPPSSPERANFLHQAAECLWRLDRGEESIRVWREALSIAEENGDWRRRLATALLALNRHAEALVELERVTQAQPDDVSVRRLAAEAALKANEHARAALHLEAVLAASPTDAEAHYQYGQALSAMRRDQRALQAFRQAARLQPGRPDYLAAIARTLAAQGEVTEAVVAAEAALDIGGDQPEALLTAGEIFQLADDYGRAIPALRRAAEHAPDDGQTWFALARALTQLAESDDPRLEAGLPPSGGLAPAELRTQLGEALQRAAQLGVNPATLREWLGRARAFTGDPKEAIVLLEASTTSRPTAEAFYALGHAYRRDGLLDRARVALEASLARDSLSPLTLIELAQSNLALGDKAAALSAAQRAVALAPRNAAAYFFLAECLLALGDRLEAASALSRALALEPGAAHWHYRLAGIYDARRETSAALGHYQRAAELEPERAEYVLGLARGLARNGDLTTAARHYEAAVALEPAAAAAWTERGHVALTLGDVELAAQCFDNAIGLAPNKPEALVGNARTALALGHVLKAQANVQAALRLRPNDPAALACLSEVNAARGDVAGALEANAKAAALVPAGPDGISLRLARARILRSAGQLDEALAELRALTEAEPECDEAFAMLGEALLVTRRFEEAIAAFHTAVAIAPRDPCHLLRLGSACLESGQLDQALAHLLRALELAPDDAEVNFEIGRAYEGRRQPDRALDAFQKALRLDPTHAEYFFHAALAYKALRQYPEAKLMLEKTIELEPTHVEAHRQLVPIQAFELLHNRPSREHAE